MATTTTTDSATLIKAVTDAIFAYQKAALTYQAAVNASSSLANKNFTSASDVQAFVDASTTANLAYVDVQQALSTVNFAFQQASAAATVPQEVINQAAANGITLASSPSGASGFQNCTSDDFQGIRFYDGTSFGYLRVFADKVQLLCDVPMEFAIDGTKLHTYRITGHGSDIKLYIDGQLALDGTGKFSQPTANKLIEFGDIAGRNQQVSSAWDLFRYSTTGAFPPSNTEDVILEEVIAFPQSTVGRLKTYNNKLYCSVDPLDTDLSSSIYRFEKGQQPEHRPVLAITQASVSAVVIDPNRTGNLFGTSGKFIGTDNGVQYILGGKPFPFDFVTSFDAPLDGNGWELDTNCEGGCETLLNGTLTIDTTGEVDPRFHQYDQALPSDPWVKNAKNSDGWTVEVKVKIIDDGTGNQIDAASAFIATNPNNTDCSQSGGSTDGSVPPDDNLYAPGIYINDGVHQEIVQFFAKGIRLKYAKLFGSQTLTDQFYTVRIIAKNKAIAVYAKGDSDPAFKKLIFSPDAFSVTARTAGTQELPTIFVDNSGIQHAVWQEGSDSGIAIFYSRLNRATVATGSGMIGQGKFNPSNNVLALRPQLGLPPAANIDYTKVGKNILIGPSASFKKDGVKAGDILQLPQIVERKATTTPIPPKSYVIKQVIDDVLIMLDTTDDLSNIGPTDWSIVSGTPVWAIPVRVSNNSFDSVNPRVLQHTNGSIYVAYSNDESGSDQIYVRKGNVTSLGTSWHQTLQLTNSIHTARTPDLAELQDGSIIVVWQDTSNDSTGSQIFQSIIDSDLKAPLKAGSITPDAAHGRRPRVGASGNNILVVYEDDSIVQNQFEIFSVHLVRTLGGLNTVAATKVSSAFGNAQNISLNSITDVVWDEEFPDGKTEIMYSSLQDFQHAVWIGRRLTSSRGNSRRPVISSDLSVVFESDRTRSGYYELYLAKIAQLNAPLGLVINGPAGTISGTPQVTGVFNFVLKAQNAAGTDFANFTLTILDSGTPSFGPTVIADAPDLPLIFGPATATAIIGQPFAFQVQAINNPTSFDIQSRIFVSSADEGLDIKLKSYLTQNTHPATFFDPKSGLNIAWEGQQNNQRQVLYGTTYDGHSTSMDNTVLAYFPLDEQTGTEVKNRVVAFNALGAAIDPDAAPPRNGTTFHTADVYTVPAPKPVSLFDPADDRAFDLGNFGGDGFRGGFSIDTDPYIKPSGAIDMFVTPHWPSDSIAEHVFFGNTDLNPVTTTPNTMVFGVGPAMVGNVMRFRIIDSNNVVHETLIDNPSFWAAEDTVHLRAIWDSTNIGISSILGMSFTSATDGHACCANGAIFKTTDGGTTWAKQATGITYDIYSIDFFDANTGFAVGELGTVLRTTDGGTTWTVIDSGVTADLTSVFFRTALVGYACGTAGTLLRSTTGGLTWTVISTDALHDFKSIAILSDNSVVAVGEDGQVYRSTDDGVTYTALTNLPVVRDWNAISRTHQGGSFTSYIVGNDGAIVRTTDNATNWTDLSMEGPDLTVPDLFCVSHGSTSSTVWIPWGANKLAYSTDSGDSFTFVTTNLNGRFRAVDANFGGTSSGAAVIVSGIGGTVMSSPDFGVTQNFSQTVCANLTILVNGKEPTQRRNGDGPFVWDPSDSTLFFGDFQAQGSASCDAIMDEVVIYSTPTPGNSSFVHHEFRSFQTNPAAFVADDGKRIEWGAISPFIKDKTQWQAFNMFFCGPREPLQTFSWDTTCGLVDDVVTGMSLDRSGNLWIATSNGISKFAINEVSANMQAFLDGTVQPTLTSPLFTNYTNLASALVADEITAISVDQNNDVWAGTAVGLMLLEQSLFNAGISLDDAVTAAKSGTGSTGPTVFQTFTTSSGLPSNNILTIKAIGSNVFVGTDSGLFVINRPLRKQTPKVSSSSGSTADSSTKQPATSISILTSANGLPSNRIQAVAQDKTGKLYIGTDNGLCLFNGKNSVIYTTANGLISKNVLSLSIDQNNVVYVGTDFGMTRIDGTNFQSFSPVSGIGPGAIGHSAIDGVGTVWFATPNGLVEFDQNCDAFRTYGLDDGLIGDSRIVNYQRYRILGGDIPTGGCNKALVKVAVNGVEQFDGFTVDPFVPWIVFDQPLTANDVVDVCVYPSWRKVHDFNEPDKNSADNQATVNTQSSKYKLYRKRVGLGSFTLGGNFANGAGNTSTKQYSVFAQPLPGALGPVISSVEEPGTAILLSSTSIDDSFYANVLDPIISLPQELIGAQHVAFFSTDAAIINSNYLQMTLSSDAIIYVAYDSRASSLPSWLSDFEPVPVVYRVTDMETFTDGTAVEKLFVSTQGTNGCVYDVLNDPTICDISADIATDFTPPTGCATITKVNSRSSFTMSLQATDAVTGVTEMQISPRQDFTTDGTTPVPFVPFQSNYNFILPASASNTTGDIATLPPDTVAGGTTTTLPPGIINNIFHQHLDQLLLGTKNPGRVYVFDQKTGNVTLLFDTGEAEVDSMATFGNDLIVGTGTNGKSFRWNGTSLTQLPVAVGQRVLSAFVFANAVYLGYSPGGEIYTLDQFGVMQLFLNTFETAITDFATFGGRLYWTSANETVSPGDQLVTTVTKDHKHFYDVVAGQTMLSGINGFTTPAEDGHFHQIINGVIQPAENHIHFLNGSRSGKIFRYDPTTGQPIIVHADADYAATAIATTGTDPTSGLMFAGTSPHGKILRYIPEDDLFIKSFQTPKSTVNRLRFFSKMYAMVDDTIYDFTGQHWEFVAAVKDSAHDIAPQSSTSSGNTDVIILRDQNIASTSAAPQTLNPKVCAYVRFKDAAGNISSILDGKGNLVECYAPCIDLGTITGSGSSSSGGSSTGSGSGLVIGKNRLLEVDEDANVVIGLDGTEPFLSGNKIEQEVAIYFSEVFNGTNSWVQWVALSWDATTPPGTSITLAVRSAATGADIVNALWSKEFTDPTSNDLTSLTGQFLQFRATLTANQVGAPSPVLHRVDISLRTSQAVHYFTTNFSLPDELRQGLLTYNGCINPPVTDVIFGVTGQDSTDFSDYFVISPDKVFEVPSEQQTKNLRVGIKLISSPTEIPVIDEFAILVALANDAKIKFNLVGQPASTSGQLAIITGQRTVTTERVQNHTHTITFDATILDKTNINGTTSINAGHQHAIINGVIQQAAGHTHDFSI